jgi:lipoate synthase
MIEEIKQHYKDNPTHGTNCVCMDQYAREIRNAFTVSDIWAHEEEDHVAKAMRAVEGILHMVVTSLHRYQRSNKPYTEDDLL